MKNLIRKLKKTNPYFRYSFFILAICFLISIIFISRSLLLLTNVETFLRYTYIVFSIILLIAFLLAGLIFLIIRKHKAFVAFAVFVFLVTIVNFIGSYFINSTYRQLDGMYQQKVRYTTNLIALTTTTEDQIETIGMIDVENDVTGFILPNIYMEENNLDFDIKLFDDYFDMLEALYAGDIDAFWINNNFVAMFRELEEFQNIASETHIIFTSYQYFNRDASTGRAVTDPFSILIVGVDARGDGVLNENGDTIMLVTFNPRTLSATLFSIPRDTFVPITCRNNRPNKINSATVHGINCIVETVEQLVGFDVDYHVRINFQGMIALVDALGGVEVDIPVPDFPRHYCTYDADDNRGAICFEPGLQRLNGEEALAFTRIRRAFITGDFQRIQNQQAVVEAMTREMRNIRSVNDFNAVLTALTNNMDTNMPTSEMLNFYNVGRDILNRSRNTDNVPVNIQRAFLSGYDLTMFLNGVNTYTFQFYEESLNEIINAMLVNLEEKDPELIKTFSFSVNEPFVLPVIGRGFTGQRREVLPNFVGQSYSFLQNWNNNERRRLNISAIQQQGNCRDGNILQQSVPRGTLVENISSLTVHVCSNPGENTTTTPNIPNIPDVPTTTEPTTQPPIDDPVDDMLSYNPE